VSLYRQVIDTLRDEIVSNVFEVGSKLPTEEMLAQRFNVSRHTIREALKALRNEGFVKSRQGSGTIVAQSDAQFGYSSRISSIDEIFQYASDTSYSVDKVTMVVADGSLAERLNCKVGSRWLQIEGFRFQPNEKTPVCWTEVFIRSDYAGVGVMLGRRSGPIYSWIEEMYDVQVAEVEQLLTTTTLPDHVAHAFGPDADAHGVEVRRTYIVETGSVIEVAFNLHPAADFSFAMRLFRTNPTVGKPRGTS
jgi:GntR family transcriptional regulator